MSDTPLIDKRSGKELVDAAMVLAAVYAPEWKPREGDPGLALARLFTRMMEIVLQRLNRVPEKNFLAFLDTAGVVPLLPKAATAPIRFVLAAGAKGDGMAPAGTALAAAIKDVEPILFETEKTLFVTRSKLVSLAAQEPKEDAYSELAAVLKAGDANEPVSALPFKGMTLMPHRLFISHETLFSISGPARISIIFTAAAYDFRKLKWYCRVKNTDYELTPALDSDALAIVFDIVAGIDAHTMKSLEAPWVWAETGTALGTVDTDLVVTDLQCSAEANGLFPDFLYCNAKALDGTQEFYPFGDKPKLYDTFHIACREAFSKTGCTIALEPAFGPGRTMAGVALRAEFWNGGAWALLGETTEQGASGAFTDTTNALCGHIIRDKNNKPTLALLAIAETVLIDIIDVDIVAGTFKLVVKNNLGQISETFSVLTISDCESHLSGSSYITAKNLQSTSPGPDNRPTAANNISIPYPRIEFTCPAMKEAEVNGKKNLWVRMRIMGGNYGEDARLAKTGPGNTLADWTYEPPSYQPPVITSMRIAYSTPVPGMPPTHLLSYNNFRFSEGPVTVPFKPFAPEAGESLPALYMGLDSKPTPEKQISLYVSVSGAASAVTPMVAWKYWNGTDWKRLGVKDGTRNFSESGMVEFTAPPDMTAGARFGKVEERFWLRAELERGDPATFTLNGVHLNTVWAKQCTTIAGELLGSSTENPNAEFKLSRTPVLEGLEIEVREPEVPGSEELKNLMGEEGQDVIRPAAKEGETSREQWVRWHRVDHFRFSDKKSRHYTRDWSKGIIRFGDGVYGMVPPAGRSNILARWYQAGGGAKGNVARGAVSVLKRAVPFVDKAFNVDAAGGGSDGDSLEQVKIRGPQAIKHQDRAVTTEDYVWLAKEASLQVARARCLPAKTSSDAGKVRLIVVPWSDEPQPFLSEGLKRQVKEYINSSSKRIPTAELTILSPQYDPVAVTANVFPENMERADEIRRAVQERLQAFLHPLTGGPEKGGWEFGRGVYVSEICKVLEDTEGVHHAENVKLSSDIQNIHDSDHIPGRDEFLVASGEHTLTIKSLYDV
jgi:hypothetical protein